MSEDQDRIQKSFRVLPDGLVVVPFTALRGYPAQGASCDNVGGGVQLVEWSEDTLRKRALLPLPGNPRRALPNQQELLAVSDSTVRAFSLSDLDVAHVTADLTIGSCVASNSASGYGPVDPAWQGYHSRGFRVCSVAAARGGSDGWPVLLGLVALALTRLNRRRLQRRRDAFGFRGDA